MSLKVYVDYLSQPSRAVLTVLQILNIPHEVVQTRISEMAQRKPEFSQINPAKKVPAILDQDFALSESHTIMRYLIKSRNIQTTLYPLGDIKASAKIDEYLDYHHTGTRKCSVWLFNKLFAPKINVPVTVNVEQAQKDVEQVLKYFDRQILGNKTFICGDVMTLADISAYCEIIQLQLINYNFQGLDNLMKWLELMSHVPEIKKTHEIWNKIVKRQNPQAKL